MSPSKFYFFKGDSIVVSDGIATFIAVLTAKLPLRVLAIQMISGGKHSLIFSTQTNYNINNNIGIIILYGIFF